MKRKRHSPEQITRKLREADRMSPDDAGRPRRRFPAWVSMWLGAVVVYAVFLGLMEAKLYRPGVVFQGENNQIVEAHSWWKGRLDLPERALDTAVFEGRYYSHFPLLFTLIAAGLVPFFGGVPHWFVVAAIALPIPLLVYELGRRTTGSSLWGTVFGIGLACGTSLWPIVDRTMRACSAYHVNHGLATIGLLILLIEMQGRRRVWAAGIGLLIATLARPMTVGFVIPLGWLALREQPPRERHRQMVLLGVVLAVVAVIPLTANTLKFGDPLTTGYMLIYKDRSHGGPEDRFARDAHRYGLFSPHFVPRNLYYANVGFPEIHRKETPRGVETSLRPNMQGSGIWWTTPFLLWLWIDFRRILHDPASRGVLAAAFVIFVALLFFHATGADQRGYNRFSLDYLPGLWMVIAPQAFVGRRRWISLAMIAWSVVYFRWLI